MRGALPWHWPLFTHRDTRTQDTTKKTLWPPKRKASITGTRQATECHLLWLSCFSLSWWWYYNSSSCNYHCPEAKKQRGQLMLRSWASSSRESMLYTAGLLQTAAATGKHSRYTLVTWENNAAILHWAQKRTMAITGAISPLYVSFSSVFFPWGLWTLAGAKNPR